MIVYMIVKVKGIVDTKEYVRSTNYTYFSTINGLFSYFKTQIILEIWYGMQTIT